MNGTAIGTALNDSFSVGTGKYTLIGGDGNDRYYNVDGNTKIIETATGGIDTVYLVNSYVMADGIENAVVGYGNGIVGNKLGNYIVGSAKSQNIDGGEGNDVLTGGGGGDLFDFGKTSGYDVITDFHAGPSVSAAIVPDTIRLTGYDFTSFAQVKAAMTQVGSDVVLKLSATDAVKILDTKIADFTPANFHLKVDVSDMKQTFNDSFNSLSLWEGKSSGTWRTDFGWGDDRNALVARTLHGNNEKQIYVDTGMIDKTGAAVGINPFSVKDGVLTIHADRTPDASVSALYGYQYTSGLLTTRNSFTQTYGYFEARMELPAGKGAWPAFWLYTTGTNSSELDVMESRGSDYWTQTTHDYSTGQHEAISGTIFTPDLTKGFHTYGVMWTKETVTWYLDGVAVKSIATPADMHGPMYMLVNLAIDKSVDSSFTPIDLKVDYVRAYAFEGAEAALPPPGQTLIGTLKADTFSVTRSNDTIQEAANGGIDTVRASVDYVLPTNVENLVLLGLGQKGTGNDGVNRLEGNGLNNTLIGLGGNDVLDGKVGADTMIGGLGDDRYYADDAGDVAVELAGEGRDAVFASVDYTLGENVESLVLEGQAIRGTGNALDNTLTGNALNNHLVGGAGKDQLNGGAGADTLVGGTGDDTYTVDNIGDRVVEAADEGRDVVMSSIDFVAPVNVEQVTLTGTAVRGTLNDAGGTLYGNGSGNILTGGRAKDFIDARAGNDTIVGGAGNDWLIGGSGSDRFVFARGSGADTITDFTVGEDQIDWSSYRDAGVAPRFTQVGSTTTVWFNDTDKVSLFNVSISDLTDHHVFG